MKKLKFFNLTHGQKVIVNIVGYWFKDEVSCVSDHNNPSNIVLLKWYGNISNGDIYPDTKQTRAWMLIQQIKLGEI